MFNVQVLRICTSSWALNCDFDPRTLEVAPPAISSFTIPSCTKRVIPGIDTLVRKKSRINLWNSFTPPRELPVQKSIALKPTFPLLILLSTLNYFGLPAMWLKTSRFVAFYPQFFKSYALALYEVGLKLYSVYTVLTITTTIYRKEG